MSTLQPPPALHDPNTLYAAVDGRMTGLGAEEAVFFDTATGRSHVMTTDVAHAFGLCRAFLPLSQHVERIMQALPALKGQGAAIQKVLEMLIGNGLMQSDAQFVARFMREEESTLAPVSGLFVCAPARTEHLQAVLDSLVQHAQRFPLTYPVFVLDLAPDQAEASARADAITALSSTLGVKVRMVNSQHVSIILNSLATALPEQVDTLRWLLTPVDGSSGAARNLAILLAAGTRHLFLDAGMALSLRWHPERQAGLLADPRAVATRSFASNKEAVSAGSEVETDPLAAHLELCGRTVSEIMALQSQAQLQRESLLGVMAASAPWLSPERRVQFTSVGRTGRFALPDPTLPYRLPPAARAGLTATREGYLATYHQPALWSGLNHYGLGLGEYGLPFAWDTRSVVPCTLPGAGKSATLQVELMRLAHASGTDIGFPQALVQIVPGEGSDDALGRPDTAQCVSGFASVVAQDLYATDPARRLSVFAAKLQDLAGGSDQQLQNYLTEYLSWHRSNAIEQMQQAMAADPSAPVYWLADLRTAIETQGKALVSGEVPRLSGWSAALDARGCAQQFRHQLQQLAIGLEAWSTAFALATKNSAGWRDAIIG